MKYRQMMNNAVSDEEIIKMAQSAKPVED